MVAFAFCCSVALVNVALAVESFVMGNGRRKSAGSSFDVTVSKSYSKLLKRVGELLAELNSGKRGVCSSHRLMSFSVCSVSNSSASIFAAFVECFPVFF